MQNKSILQRLLRLTVICLAWIAPSLAGQSEIDEGVQLTGKVLDENDEGIIGAQVFIYTAKPRQGSSPICSYCCADCEKFTRTDEDGLFNLKDLDPKLQFRILTTATGYRSRYNQFVLPETGPLVIRLEPYHDATIPKNRKTKGRITDLEGKSIVGAKVVVEGYQNEKHVRWTLNEGMDPFAVTDAKGVFVITSDSPFESINVRIKARNHAPRLVNGMKSGKHWALQLTPGATVSGRVMMHGKPFAAAKLILSSMNRTAGFDAGDFETMTDDSGYFRFRNLPPSTDFWLNGHVDGFASHLKLEQKRLTTPKDLQEIDAGDFNFGGGYRFSGRIILENNASIPVGTKLSISQEHGPIHRQIELDATGVFDFTALPEGDYHLFVDIEGYQLSIKNPSLNQFHGKTLRGTLENNIEAFPILLEPIPSKPQSTRPQSDPKKTEAARPFRAPTQIPIKYQSK